jgi:hypothetical protein
MRDTYNRGPEISGSGEVSPQDFLAEALDHWRALDARRDSLCYVYEIFSLEGPLSMEHCARSLAHLHPIHELVQSLCDLIERAAFLKATKAIARSKTLLIKLYHSSERLGMIITLIRSYQETRRPSNGLTAGQRQEIEIRSLLKMLPDNIAEILRETQWLRDEVALSRRQ